MHRPVLARFVAFLYVLTLALPLLQLAPTAEATHSGTRNADAFRYTPAFPNRNVSYNTSGSTGWGANDNWRSSNTAFGDRTDLQNTQSQSNSGCSSGTTPQNRNGELTIWFTKQTGQHPRVNFTALDTRWLDTLYFLTDRPSSGSTNACGVPRHPFGTLDDGPP